MSSGEFQFDELALPQVVLPDQFFFGARGSAVVEGERRLLIAVVEDAVHCFKRHASASERRERERFLEVEEWFMEEDTGAAFSFGYICEALEIDARFIRSGLRRWIENRNGSESWSVEVTRVDRERADEPSERANVAPFKNAAGQ